MSHGDLLPTTVAKERGPSRLYRMVCVVVLVACSVGLMRWSAVFSVKGARVPVEHTVVNDTVLMDDTIQVAYLNNLIPQRVVDIYWLDDKHQEHFQNTYAHGEVMRQMTYYGHVFVVRDHETGAFISSVAAEPHHQTDGSRPTPLQPNGKLVFTERYRDRSGKDWINSFPPPTPVHTPFPAKTDSVLLDNGHMDRDIVVRSVSPRVLEVSDFMTEEEEKQIMRYIERKYILESVFYADPYWNPALESVTARVYELLGLRYSRKLYAQTAEHIHIRHITSQHRAYPQPMYFSLTEEHKHMPSLFTGSNRFATVTVFLTSNAGGGFVYAPAQDTDVLCSDPQTTVSADAFKAVLNYHWLDDGNLDERSVRFQCPLDDRDLWMLEFHVWNRYSAQ